MDDDEDRDAQKQPCCDDRRSSLAVAVAVHSSLGTVGVQTARVFSRPEHFHGTREELMRSVARFAGSPFVILFSGGREVREGVTPPKFKNSNPFVLFPCRGRVCVRTARGGRHSFL
jgi:hypothetical protein